MVSNCLLLSVSNKERINFQNIDWVDQRLLNSLYLLISSFFSSLFNSLFLHLSCLSLLISLLSLRSDLSLLLSISLSLLLCVSSLPLFCSFSLFFLCPSLSDGSCSSLSLLSLCSQMAVSLSLFSMTMITQAVVVCDVCNVFVCFVLWWCGVLWSVRCEICVVCCFVYVQNAHNVYVQKRLHVCRENGRVSFDRRRVDSTHGSVFECTHGPVSGRLSLCSSLFFSCRLPFCSQRR